MAPIGMLSSIFPPAPPFTDKHLPALNDKVYIITGAASGVGYELAKILYSAGGTVYIAARSTSRCSGAIIKLQEEVTIKTTGRLESMVIDLSDLRTIKPAAEAFLRTESRLDVLFHNAAVMAVPAGSKDALGHDLEHGTNCLGPYLLTLLLEPALIKTATTQGSSKGSVRIVWVTSMLTKNVPKGGAPMQFNKDGGPVYHKAFMDNYMQSKNGVSWLADKFAKRLGNHGIISISLHPGLMLTELQRHSPAPMRLAMSLAFKPPVYGAYSELWAGFSPDVKMEHNGGYTMAWGRHGEMPKEMVGALKGKSEGGSGIASTFYEYCDRETKNYL